MAFKHLFACLDGETLGQIVRDLSSTMTIKDAKETCRWISWCNLIHNAVSLNKEREMSKSGKQIARLKN